MLNIRGVVRTLHLLEGNIGQLNMKIVRLRQYSLKKTASKNMVVTLLILKRKCSDLPYKAEAECNTCMHMHIIFLNKRQMRR